MSAVYLSDIACWEQAMADLSWPPAYFCGKLNWKGYDCKSSKDLEVLPTDEIDYFLVCCCNCRHLPKDLG